MRIVLAGEESAGAQALEVVLGAPVELVAVLTSEPAPGRGGALWKAATRRNLPVWPAHRVRDADFAGELAREGVDLLLNVHSLHVVHAEVLRACRLGAFNLHPGPLPRYAGLHSVSWAILRGEPRHGVTLHWMEPGIDVGAIAYQELFDIAPDDSPVALMSRCVRLGMPLIARLLAEAAANPGAIPREAQDLSRREYFGREVPHGGRIRWELPAIELERFTRACDYGPFPSPWGSPTARYQGRALEVRRATAVEEQPSAPAGTVLAAGADGALVACGTGTLRIERLRLGGERASPDALEPGQRIENG